MELMFSFFRIRSRETTKQLHTAKKILNDMVITNKCADYV